MSHLIDKIKKQTDKTPAQMGFRRTLPEEAKTKILLIAGVDIKAGGPALKNIDGADAILLNANDFELTAETLTKMVKPLKGTPWGVFLEESKDTAGALEKAGCDFFVASPASPVTILPEENKIGKIISVDSSMDDSLLRAVNDLPVDGVLAADTFGENNPLTWHHLMIMRNLALLVGKPLMVPVPAAISKDELKALWDAGIEAVIVPVDVTKDESLKDLHEIAVKLPARSARKAGKVDVFLPRAGGKPAEPPQEEEDDE